MNRVTVARTAFLAVLLATCAAGSDKTPRTYQKGTVKGWENRTDIWGAGLVGTDGEGVPRRVTVFELKGTDLVYLIDYCGAFQAGQFGLGQAVDYRVDGERLYIRRDNGKEYKCKVEGQRTPEEVQKAPEEAKTVAPSAKP
jgi:hypothetical protein